MSPTSANPRRRGATAAFTLVELIVSVALSTIIFAGILGGYTFLARNFTRLLNTQDQDAKSRRAVYVFSQDVGVATQISNPTARTLTLTFPAGSYPKKINNPDGTTKIINIRQVDYCYTEPNPADKNNGVLKRQETTFDNATPLPQDPPKTLLENVTSPSVFSYFNNAGNSTSAALSIKEIELKFTSAVGNTASGTQSRYTAVSPRLVLRNKPLLSTLP